MTATTTTTDIAAARAAVLGTFMHQLVEAQLASDCIAVNSREFIVKTGDEALLFYTKDGRLNVRVTTVANASRLSESAAQTAARNVHNGVGTVGRVLPLRDALHEDIQKLEKMIADITAA